MAEASRQPSIDMPFYRISAWKHIDPSCWTSSLECMKISFSYILLPVPRSLYVHTLYLSLPGLHPCACLPAAYKRTAHFCLAALRLAGLLESERTWDTHVAVCQPVCVFWITGVFIEQLSVCVCVCVCQFESAWVTGMTSECASSIPLYMSQDTSACADIHTLILSHLILRFCYAVSNECMFHCDCTG